MDEARWQWRDDPKRLTVFIERLSALPGHYDRAMITYLDHPKCWRGAIWFYHADALPYWRNRKHLGHRLAKMDAASLEKLADLIRTYFHRNKGRGKHCVVESCRRGELDYFFAYPEDYSQQRPISSSPSSLAWLDSTRSQLTLAERTGSSSVSPAWTGQTAWTRGRCQNRPRCRRCPDRRSARPRPRAFPLPVPP